MSAIPESEDSQSVLPRLTTASVIGAALQTMRPYQWLKNLLVFVPLAAAHRLGERDLLAAAVCSFVAFSLCASGVYVFNDLRDAHGRSVAPAQALPADRLRGVAPIDRDRARSGAARRRSCRLTALGPACRSDSRGLRHLDGRVLAQAQEDRAARRAGIGGRLRAARDRGRRGGGHSPLSQLLEFCILLFFSLALVKRYAELALLRVRDGPAARAAPTGSRIRGSYWRSAPGAGWCRCSC